MRFLRNSILIFIASLMIFVGRVEATDGLRGDECVVQDNEYIQEDFYFFCNTLVIYGVVDGDLIGVASEVTIAAGGRVMGAVWVGGGHLTIEGTVENDLHFLGVDLDIIGLARFPNPETDLVMAGLSAEIATDTIIPGNIIFYGYQAILNGKVNGNVDFQGQTLIIENAIAGNVEAIVGDQESNAPLTSLPLVYSVDFQKPGLRFGEEGYINGMLDYEAPQRASVVRNVGGSVDYKQSISRANITQVEQSETFLQILGNYIVTTVQDVAALSLIGILIVNFFSKAVLEPSYRVQTRFISAFAWGLTVTLLSIPFGLLMLITSLIILIVTAIITINELTVITAILVTVFNLGLIGGFVFLLVFLGRVVTCFVIGFFVVRLLQQLMLRYKLEVPRAMGEVWFAVVTGVLLVSLLVNMPLGSFVGLLQLLFTGLISFTGFGAIFMYLRDLWFVGDRRLMVFGRSPASPFRAVPPPPDDDMDVGVDTPVGMDNLPLGFRWFDE